MTCDWRQHLPAELRMLLNGFYLYGIKRHPLLTCEWHPLVQSYPWCDVEVTALLQYQHYLTIRCGYDVKIWIHRPLVHETILFISDE
jgi:hypothetical protein